MDFMPRSIVAKRGRPIHSKYSILGCRFRTDLMSYVHTVLNALMFGSFESAMAECRCGGSRNSGSQVTAVIPG
ncbi:MAG: hypothetical protein A2X67_05835 [Ignavibacteria bacterium GWA2_55_11]|nr:MAG: hypothetical protein A2X67_05835 [Ignavibacteria bacterium GWA2_55_11]OGU67152.1 MAG: hypothetical protein A3C56_06940 [Ignavibacteria bacterium RIFCSPHIGHO2_02_FULL_56_12]